MKSKCVLLSTVIAALILGTGLVGLTYAEEAEQANEEEKPTEEFDTSISLSPVSKVLQLSSSSKYEDSFEVKNDGNKNLDIEVYAAPYSYVYSEETNVYQLGFSHENNFTQITRWISFKDSGGKWVEKPKFTVKAKDKIKINYRIVTPENIPAGGQYAVLFAHTLSSVTTASGIRTEASPGLIVYGRSKEGTLDRSSEISDMKIEHVPDKKENADSEESEKHNTIVASAKIKNNGNVDFSASGILKIDPIIGSGSYESENGGTYISVIPESELVLSDEWKDAPSFGIYKATWTVGAGDSETQVVEKILFINPLPLILITIILLTIIGGWVTITVRKRKERRSRLSA